MSFARKMARSSLSISGLLFLAVAVLDFFAGQPPSHGDEILAWAAGSKVFLALSNETLFFAVVFMIPGIQQLDRLLARTKVNELSIGVRLFKLVIPVLATSLIVQGRLVFPVFGINLSANIAELLVSLWYGGLHAAYLLAAGATILVGLDLMKVPAGKMLALLGFATALSDLAGSYPWLISRVPMLVCQTLFGLWFLIVGIKLHSTEQIP